jgi:hypothetical protein
MQQVAHIAKQLDVRAEEKEFAAEMVQHVPRLWWFQDCKIVHEHLASPLQCRGFSAGPKCGWHMHQDHNHVWLVIGERQISVSRTQSNTLVKILGYLDLRMGPHMLAVFLDKLRSLDIPELEPESRQALRQFQASAAQLCGAARIWRSTAKALPIAALDPVGMRAGARASFWQELIAVMPTPIVDDGQLGVRYCDELFVFGDVHAFWRTVPITERHVCLRMDMETLDIIQVQSDLVQIGQLSRWIQVGCLGLRHFLFSLSALDSDIPESNRAALHEFLSGAREFKLD